MVFISKGPTDAWAKEAERVHGILRTKVDDRVAISTLGVSEPSQFNIVCNGVLIVSKRVCLLSSSLCSGAHLGSFQDGGFQDGGNKMSDAKIGHVAEIIQRALHS